MHHDLEHLIYSIHSSSQLALVYQRTWHAEMCSHLCGVHCNFALPDAEEQCLQHLSGCSCTSWHRRQEALWLLLLQHGHTHTHTQTSSYVNLSVYRTVAVVHRDHRAFAEESP